MRRVHLIITSRVQGVGYRYFTREQAQQLQVSGWVRNCADGSVEAEIQGDENKILAMLDILKQGPRFGRVSQIAQYDLALVEGDSEFKVVH